MSILRLEDYFNIERLWEKERVDIIHAKDKQSQTGIHQEDQDDEIEPGNEGNNDAPGDKPEAT